MSAYRASRMLRMCLGGISEGPASVRHEARAPGHQFSLLSGGTPRLPALTLTSESDSSPRWDTPSIAGWCEARVLVGSPGTDNMFSARRHQVRSALSGLELSAPAACFLLLCARLSEALSAWLRGLLREPARHQGLLRKPSHRARSDHTSIDPYPVSNSML